jgi:hypothetical protein
MANRRMTAKFGSDVFNLSTLLRLLLRQLPT